jgi:DNA-directed RNA polymerase subunit beta'
VIAAQSIGEPGTQLTMRTFHVGGAASRAARRAASRPSRRCDPLYGEHALRHQSKNEKIVISRSAEVMVTDDNGRERERHKVPYGATLLVDDGKSRSRPARSWRPWDPHTRPIVTEYAGTVKFENVEEGVTVAKQIDEVTGLSTLVVIDPKRRQQGTSKGVRPQVKLLTRTARKSRLPVPTTSVTITFQVGSLITVKDGQQVSVGDMLARIPAGVGEDPRHYRRSAACGRAVRSASPEGCRRAGRSHRHRFLRQGHQGQAASGDHRAGRHAHEFLIPRTSTSWCTTARW